MYYSHIEPTVLAVSDELDLIRIPRLNHRINDVMRLVHGQ